MEPELNELLEQARSDAEAVALVLFGSAAAGPAAVGGQAAERGRADVYAGWDGDSVLAFEFG